MAQLHSRHKVLGSISKNSVTSLQPQQEVKAEDPTVILCIVGSWTAGLRARLKENP